MLRSGVHRLSKASGSVQQDINGLIQDALHPLPMLESCLLEGWRGRRRYSQAAGEEEERQITNPKVLELAEQITQLNLLEVSDLTEVLRKRLNIQVPVAGMGFAAMPVAAAPSGAPSAGGESAAAEPEKTDFTVKLSGFDAAAKIKVIKEVRGITDLGLKEAKELVESAPAVLKKGLSKDEAEQLKSKLEAAGAKIALE